jgi:hypothetical protein
MVLLSTFRRYAYERVGGGARRRVPEVDEASSSSSSAWREDAAPNIASTLDMPTTGEVTVAARGCADASGAVRGAAAPCPSCSVVQPAPGLAALESVGFLVDEAAAGPRAGRVLGDVGLEARPALPQLSGGGSNAWRRARTRDRQPVLLADEPTGKLDFPGRRDRRLLRASEPAAVLVVTRADLAGGRPRGGALERQLVSAGPPERAARSRSHWPGGATGLVLDRWSERELRVVGCRSPSSRSSWRSARASTRVSRA